MRSTALVSPLYHALLGVGRDRDMRWFWHVPASLCSLVGTVWGLQTELLHRHNKRLVAQLQPRQTLRAAPEPAAPHDLNIERCALGVERSTFIAQPSTLNPADLETAKGDVSQNATPGFPSRPRLDCFTNGLFADQVSGGEVYYSHVLRAALEAGHELHFFGGHATRAFLERFAIPAPLSLTDSGLGKLGDPTSFSGQVRLLWDFTSANRPACAPSNGQ